MEELIRAIVGSQEFSEFVLTTAQTIAVTVAGIVIYQFRKFVAAHTTDTEIVALNDIAAVAVTYVEQKFKDLDGPAKYAEAEAAANALIARTGIKVSVEQLRTIIESAVFTELNSAPTTDTVEPPDEGADG